MTRVKEMRGRKRALSDIMAANARPNIPRNGGYSDERIA